MNWVLLLLLGGLMHATISFRVAEEAKAVGTSLALGYLILTAFFAGKVFRDLRLPRLTGYLVAGVLVGPDVLRLITPESVEQLKLINGVAIALIALTAGSELELKAMRPLLRTIGWITACGVVGTSVLLGCAAYWVRPLLPFMSQMSGYQALAVAWVLGTVMAAQSPAVIVALRDELKADGPVARTMLGVVVVADLVVIVLYTVASATLKAQLGIQGNLAGTIWSVGRELFGSLAAGVGVGAILAAYLRWVNRAVGLFSVTTSFVLAEVGQRLGMDPLLIALAAGLLLRNLTSFAPVLHKELEAAALPVYVVFFAVAGTTLHLSVLLLVGVPVLIFVAVRGAGLLAGSRVGAKLAGAPEPVQRLAGYGLLPQAGLALALSVLFARTFPEFGAGAGALTLGVVAVNELLAPVICRLALLRSGEAMRMGADD